jgi:hypothetical protein
MATFEKGLLRFDKEENYYSNIRLKLIIFLQDNVPICYMNQQPTNFG